MSATVSVLAALTGAFKHCGNVTMAIRELTLQLIDSKSGDVLWDCPSIEPEDFEPGGLGLGYLQEAIAEAVAN